MRVELFITVYHRDYPDVRDVHLEMEEMIDCANFEGAKERLKSLMNVLMPVVYPDCPSTSGVRIPGGETWTYTDVM